MSAAQSGKGKHPDPGSKQGIKTPGVQIPFTNLKAEVELPLAPQWMVFSDTILIPNKAGGLERLDAKTNKLVDPVRWNGQIVRRRGDWIHEFVDSQLRRAWADAARREGRGRSEGACSFEESHRTGCGSETPQTRRACQNRFRRRQRNAGGCRQSRQRLDFERRQDHASRIDPDQNKIVSELRLPAGCNTLTFGETALWVTCPAENRVLRINPETTLVEKRIEVSPQPTALAIGESSVWVLCIKDGKIERIDPKTNKVTKTIETGVSGATTGGIAVGQGSIWVTLTGFPITRIDPVSEKVVQQFWGAGGGAIQFGAGLGVADESSRGNAVAAGSQANPRDARGITMDETDSSDLSDRIAPCAGCRSAAAEEAAASAEARRFDSRREA